jgi:hypothetical protein
VFLSIKERRNAGKSSIKNQQLEQYKDLDNEDDDEDELDKSDENITNIREKRFRSFASIEFNDEIYMVVLFYLTDF